MKSDSARAMEMNSVRNMVQTRPTEASAFENYMKKMKYIEKGGGT